MVKVVKKRVRELRLGVSQNHLMLRLLKAFIISQALPVILTDALGTAPSIPFPFHHSISHHFGLPFLCLRKVVVNESNHRPSTHTHLQVSTEPGDSEVL